MAAIVARPATPFPTTESISYFAPQASSSSSSSSRRQGPAMTFAHPLHFQIPHRAAPTPPSLLKRTSSSGSSSSYHLSRTPSANTPTLSPTTTFSTNGRRASTCSSISGSGSEGMPATPITEAADESMLESELEALEELDDIPELAPSPSTTSHVEAKGRGGFPVKQFYSTLQSITTTSIQTPAPSAPKRPKMIRRDTPRPTPDAVPAMSAFWDHPILAPINEIRPQRRLTSVVDGKSWIVVA